jgi:hypothetical protein
MELAAKYRENAGELRRLFIERLTPEEQAEVERLMEVAELEALFIAEQYDAGASK